MYAPESKAANLRKLIVSQQRDERNCHMNLELRVPHSFSSSNKPFEKQMAAYLSMLFSPGDYYVYPVTIPEETCPERGASAVSTGPTLMVTLLGAGVEHYAAMMAHLARQEPLTTA